METLLGIMFVIGVGLISLFLPAGTMFTGAEEARRERSRIRSRKRRV